jgi:hypothetical protein
VPDATVLRIVVVGPVQGRTTLLGPVAVVFVNTVNVAEQALVQPRLSVIMAV